MTQNAAETLSPWRVAGSYFEACNCEVICPCRLQGGKGGGRSTYGECDFALSWWIEQGRTRDLDLVGLGVLLAGSFTDAGQRTPWRVALYLDERATPAQQDALAAIYLGRAGGRTLQNFAVAFGEILSVRTARIELDHSPGRERARAGPFVTFAAAAPVRSEEPVTCGIPGHDQPGTELLVEHMAVNDGPLQWDLHGRCGFASRFDYRSGNDER